jgi:hypothetical protein
MCADVGVKLIYLLLYLPNLNLIVLGCLLGTELKLSIALFSLFVGSTQNVFNEDLRIAPSVRQNGVGRDRLVAKVCQDELSQHVEVEKSHGVYSSGSVERRRAAINFCGGDVSRMTWSRRGR